MSQFEDKVHAVEKILGDKIAEPLEEYEGFRFGDRVVLLDDLPGGYAFAGEKGTVVIEKVGAAEYGNVRTSLAVVFDGMDVPEEVSPSVLEPA